MPTIPLLPGIDIQQADIVVIKDYPDSPCTFLLGATLTTALKADCHVILLSALKELAFWTATQSKNGISLDKYTTEGRFSFLDVAGLSLVHPGTQVLRHLFTQTVRLLALAREKQLDSVILLEDLGHLTWMGLPERDLRLFLRAVRSLTRKNSVTLIHNIRLLDFEPPSESAKEATELAHTNIEVLPLLSGRSGAISGEIIARRGPLDEQNKLIYAGQNALQYRLTDFSAVFFHKGTGAGTL